MSVKIINAQLVHQLLPMAKCIELMEEAMNCLSRGMVDMPPRAKGTLANSGGLYGLMAGATTQLKTYGVKVFTIHDENSRKGLPSIHGSILLFDCETGAPKALIEGAAVTAIRTAAASGLATRLLARADAKSCGVFGTGVLAVTHIEAVCAVRSIDKVLVWGRNKDKAEQFAYEQSKSMKRDVVAVSDPSEAASSDIICTVTSATKPVLRGEWVRPGAHVNLVGAHSHDAREADTNLMDKSAIYVDSVGAMRQEAGDILIPIAEGALAETDIIGEVGQILNGDVKARDNDEQVTVYKSVGIFAQDLFAADYIYQMAENQDIGDDVDFT